ncbi:MAG: apolipoprotein N-acyltransferase [Desulfovermiculus sp.]
MSNRFFWALLICLAGTWLGFSNPVLHVPGLVLVLPLVLSWLAFEAGSLGRAFVHGWLAASTAYAAALYWVSIPVHDFGSLPWIAALPCPVLLGLYLGLYAGLFCLVLAWAAPRMHWSLLCLLVWTTWTCLEYAREIAFTGFPWLGLAQALAPWPLILQGSALLGAHGLSGFLAAVAVCVLLGFERKTPRLAAVAAVCACLAFGYWHMQHPLPEKEDEIKAALIQGNIDQSLKWDPEYQQHTLDRYLDMSRRAIAKEGADILIWPETALPFYVQEDSHLTEQVKEFCRSQDVALLTGSPGYSRDEDNQNTIYHNQAYLLNSAGRIQDVYGKQHLVPFGEYIPFGRYLPFDHKLVHGVGDFRPGDENSPLIHADLAMGGLICYEIIFPGRVQQRVADGANILVNLSNDAWFGRSSGAWQHLNQAVLRSIEQGRYMLRATNTGISALIDSKGRILNRSRWFEPHILYIDHLYLVQRQTFYSKHFQAIRTGFFLILTSLFLLAAGAVQEKTRTSDKPET